MTGSLRVLILTAAVALALPAAAAAEPARTATLDASTTEFKWSGGPITGLAPTVEIDEQNPCGNPGHECEDTLLNLPVGGDLTVKIHTEDDNADLDLYLYESDSSGKPGKQLVSSTAFQVDEQVTKARLKPGYYLVRVNSSIAAATTYDGVATLKNAGGPAVGLPGVPGPGTVPSNVAPTLTIAKFKASKKLKGFSGKAADDKGIAKVEIALYKSCKTALDAKGRFKKVSSCAAGRFLVAKGAKSWSFKLKRKLGKGVYTLFVRATDTDGASSSQKVTFKVK